MTDRDTARAAKEELRSELAQVPGVTGIGLARRQDDYVISVTVTEQATCDHVPPHFHGVTVEVRVSGPVRARRTEAGPQVEAGADVGTPEAPHGGTVGRATDGPGCGPRVPGRG